MWLINQHITFDPDRRLLRDRHDNELLLNQSSARCLALFLQKPGEVISHETLLDEGWRSQGVHVTENSLRQMLSMLRKQFLQLRVEGETFVTVHRQGYRLHESVRVEACLPLAEAVEEARITQEARIQPLVTTHVHTAPLPVMAPPPAVIPGEEAPAAAPRSRYGLILIGMLVSAVLLLVLALLGIKVLEIRDVVTVTYIPYSHAQGRQWYIQDDFSATEREEIDHNLQLMSDNLARFVQLAEDERHIYINRTKLADRYSWFICQNPIEQKDASCRSAIYFVAG
ncbi:winged helix-turn-helix domain-containing protein [Pantoea dispersa]|uniref:winged helix-turn-helix domain-containing protein n=1 Tax=Pantoea dispersa TaxID=59814 RepID=UPI002DBE83ED|nr:winged helix-turn-helix domain-containing protein [Pantoea dispersa]MEB5973915.1 winged helix-turn-helix domain-containing protein [Pantoea dispersa]